MKALVIGQGGREHAIVKALAASPLISGIHVIPGNHGMAAEVLCHKIDTNNPEEIIQFCHRMEIDFVVIGPEDFLVNGISDKLRQRGILVVGPSAEAAQLEGSKVFAKKFMQAAGVSTSKFKVVHSVAETISAAAEFTPPYVLKANGLAAGKGVTINKTMQQLQEAAEDLFVNKIFGVAGDKAVLEQFLPGYELSLLVLTDGKSFELLPIAQDHKQLLENDQGPNTGGMGTVAPMNISESLKAEIIKNIVQPTVDEIQRRGFIYRGVIFFGLMITESGPMCLEYNVRFGDPETQVILPLLNGDWGEIFAQLSKGKLLPLKWKSQFATCVVLAAEGYPQRPVKGAIIKGDILKETPTSYFVHAGTQKDADGHWLTNGGRVLGAVGLGNDLSESSRAAYAQAAWVSWEGLQMRKDIGKRTNKI